MSTAPSVPFVSLTNDKVIADLEARLGKRRVLSRLIERTAKAGDASIYRLTPLVVVQPETVEHVQSVLEYCRENGLYLTFRAAGTSLSGQAVTDGILVDLSSYWKRMRILGGGERVAVEPGVIASHVNAFLAPYRRKIGPDPASINACMMGGVAANNASGMCCGVEFNSYHTMHGLKMVLPDGLAIDTSQPGADEMLQRERPELYGGLLRIRQAIVDDVELRQRVSRKFSIKNTCGYSMNAFVDFERPIDILSHLLIGSEGTLGFISEITLNTLPDKPLKATALVYFRELTDAGASVDPLERAGAAVLEIMDRASMVSVAEEMQYPFSLAHRGAPAADDSAIPSLKEESDDPMAMAANYEAVLHTDVRGGMQAPAYVNSNCAALLIEFQEDDEGELQAKLAEATRILQQYPLLTPVEFTRDPKVQADYWHMRKGLFPSVGAMREIGTAVIIEDVCVEPRYLAEAIADIQPLFDKYSFPDAIIFGHARNGNIHFVICTDFADPVQVRNYAGLMDELTAMIVSKYDGSLKAEHGTGRNIAPFVEREWGEKLTELMWDVKGLIDPLGVLSPGVLLNRDPEAHLKDLKVMPAVSAVVDKCIECGFCEPRCPSRDLTITPRQRIVVLREVERLKTLGDELSLSTVAQLLEEYEYDGKETCAADGMCATACPVKINTGEMIKDLRAEEHGAAPRWVAERMVRQFKMLTAGAQAGFGVMQAGGAPARAVARGVMGALNAVSGGKVPKLPAGIPIPGPAGRLPRPLSKRTDKTVVYFPTCLSRTMGELPGENLPVNLSTAVVSVLEACGRSVVIPKKVNSLCCGQPFFSKGFTEAGKIAAEKTLDALWEASEEGRWPVVCDTSPCSGQMAVADKFLSGERLARWKKLVQLDLPTYLAREVIPERSDWPQASRRALLHPVCTAMKFGWTGDLKKVAETFAEQVDMPVLAECCGFAGDRGFLFPELTLSATAPESEEARARTGIDTVGSEDKYFALKAQGPCGAGECSGKPGYYSTCRTCEIGMTAGTDQVYSNIIFLVYEALGLKAQARK